MAILSITLPLERWHHLVEIAERLGVTPDTLVSASLDEFLDLPDEVFERAVERVLAKNAELYRRLA